MLGSRTNMSAMAALAMMGAVAGGQTLEIQPTWSPTLRRLHALSPMTYATRRGAGISMAQQKRASRKAKNVKRHKSRA